MNKDLKDIQKWRQLTESILNEQDETIEQVKEMLRGTNYLELDTEERDKFLRVLRKGVGSDTALQNILLKIRKEQQNQKTIKTIDAILSEFRGRDRDEGEDEDTEGLDEV